MPIFFLTGVLPQSYWIILIIICLAIIGVSVYYLVRNRKFHVHFLQMLSQSVDNLQEIEYCQIDNLPDAKQILQNNDYPLMKQAAEKIELDSKRLYQGKWIGDPQLVLTMDRVLTKSQYRSLTAELPVQIFSLSFLSSSMLLVFGLRSQVDRVDLIQTAFLPLFIGAICVFFLLIQSHRGRQNIQRGMNLLSETLTEKLPVFRELAGTAALIESFFRYDRQMADSITQISKSVEDLTNHKLSEHLAQNVKEVMQTEISPPIQNAVLALEQLTYDIAEKQSLGMHELADNFANNLAETMDEKLSPFYREISNLTTDLFEANKQTEMALSVMEEYKQQSLDLQQGLAYSIDTLAQARQVWEQDMNVHTQAVYSLAETSSSLSKLQEGSEQNLLGALLALRDKFDDTQEKLMRVTQGLHLENEQMEEVVHSLTESSRNTLADMRQLTLLLVNQTDLMQKQQEALQENLTSIDESLKHSIQAFSTQMLTGVQGTLDSFDEGLAEVTSRLSNTTAEIQDTVGNWATDIRWSEEYRYRNQRSQERASEGRQQQLLDILHSGQAPTVEDIEKQQEALKKQMEHPRKEESVDEE